LTNSSLNPERTSNRDRTCAKCSRRDTSRQSTQLWNSWNLM